MEKEKYKIQNFIIHKQANWKFETARRRRRRGGTNCNIATHISLCLSFMAVQLKKEDSMQLSLSLSPPLSLAAFSWWTKVEHNIKGKRWNGKTEQYKDRGHWDGEWVVTVESQMTAIQREVEA